MNTFVNSGNVQNHRDYYFDNPAMDGNKNDG